jgi:hypothetical protein
MADTFKAPYPPIATTTAAAAAEASPPPSYAPQQQQQSTWTPPPAPVPDVIRAPCPPTVTATAGAAVAEAGPAKVIYVAPAEEADTCKCTAGWWMFGLGWWLCLPWAVGAALPFCSKGKRPNVRRNNRNAAIGSAVMLLLTIIAIIVVVAVARRGGGGRSITYTTSRGTGSSIGSGSASTVTWRDPSNPDLTAQITNSNSRTSSNWESSSNSQTGWGFQG